MEVYNKSSDYGVVVINDVNQLKEYTGDYSLMDFFVYKHTERMWTKCGKTVYEVCYGKRTLKSFYERIEGLLVAGYRFVLIPEHCSIPSENTFWELTDLYDSAVLEYQKAHPAYDWWRDRVAIHEFVQKKENEGLYEEVR